MARDISKVPMDLLTPEELESEIQRLDGEVQARRARMRALNTELSRRQQEDRTAAAVAAMSPTEREAMARALAAMPAQSINVPAPIPSEARVIPPGAG